MESIVVTVNLPGSLGAPVRHTNRQKNTITVSSDTPPHTPTKLTRTILHSDREPMPCYRCFTVEEDVLNSWIKGECPSWIKPHAWKNLAPKQRILAYLITFDEGCGVSYR